MIPNDQLNNSTHIFISWKNPLKWAILPRKPWHFAVPWAQWLACCWLQQIVVFQNGQGRQFKRFAPYGKTGSWAYEKSLGRLGVGHNSQQLSNESIDYPPIVSFWGELDVAWVVEGFWLSQQSTWAAESETSTGWMWGREARTYWEKLPAHAGELSWQAQLSKRFRIQKWVHTKKGRLGDGSRTWWVQLLGIWQLFPRNTVTCLFTLLTPVMNAFHQNLQWPRWCRQHVFAAFFNLSRCFVPLLSLVMVVPATQHVP